MKDEIDGKQQRQRLLFSPQSMKLQNHAGAIHTDKYMKTAVGDQDIVLMTDIDDGDENAENVNLDFEVENLKQTQNIPSMLDPKEGRRSDQYFAGSVGDDK